MKKNFSYIRSTRYTLHAPPLYLGGHSSSTQRPRAPGGREPVAVPPLQRLSPGPSRSSDIPPPTPRKTPGISERPPPRRTAPARRQGGRARRRLPLEGSQSILPRCAGGQEWLQESDSGSDVIYPRRVNSQGGVCVTYKGKGNKV